IRVGDCIQNVDHDRKFSNSAYGNPADLCNSPHRGCLLHQMKPLQVSLYWFVYRHNNSITIVIEPAPSFIHARIRAAGDGLDQGEFTEGHELPRKWKIFKEMIGRRLTQAEAEAEEVAD